MALVLNATKEFCSDRMIPDSGGGGQFSDTDSLADREPGTFRCSFCPGTFSTLYHLQCHNVYKHSSILKNGHREDMPVESHPLDLKTNSMYQSHVKSNDNITVSESGALDLSTVRNRQESKSKPEYDDVSSTISNEADDSDYEEDDKLVIDTREDSNQEVEISIEEESVQNLSSQENNGLNHSQENNGLNQNSLQNSANLLCVNSKNNQDSQSHPENFSRDQRTFHSDNPSTYTNSVDHQPMSPPKVNTHFAEPAKPSDINTYALPYYSHAENKFPNMGNQSLLNMIPPLQNMGMMGNFPVPFGFNPFMMMPPNSFMPPSVTGNFQENRVIPPNDAFSTTINSPLPYNTNLNLQQSKAGPVKRNSGSKNSRSSSKSNNDTKKKDVVEIYECKTCRRRFSQVGNFHNHMKTHESKVCACGLCEMEFSDSYELQRHMRNTHTGSMPYKCEQCDREFSQYNNLRRHLRVHNGKNYKCHLCGRTFNEVFYLEMHMGSHTGERTYKCGVCNAVFGDNAELQKHVSTHSAEELHTCDVCGKSFSKACVLRQHKKMHSGVRPFKCEVCDKSFIHRHHLTIHSRMHSTNKPYICKICKKEFAQTSHLYKHIRQHTEQPGITEAMIHESLAPILEKLKQSDSPISSPSVDSSDERISDAINNNIGHDKSKQREEPPDSSEVPIENEMKMTEFQEKVSDPTFISEAHVKDTDQNHSINKMLKESEMPLQIDSMPPHIIGNRMNVKQIMAGTFKEMQKLLTFHENEKIEGDKTDDLDEKKSEILESDDALSDKTGTSVTSSQSNKSYLNSPHSGFPYDEQCLKETDLPKFPETLQHEQYRIRHDINGRKDDEHVRKVTENDRYSPISQSSEEDFHVRSNSQSENHEPKSKINPSVSPRIVPSEKVLKEQHIPQDNCPDDSAKTEIIMPPKKRRRYTPRPKKKLQEATENQPVEHIEKPHYQQMIQPMAAEAQQMYFLQLQQMQMALAANVMAAQGMMMQNASEQMKNVHPENQRLFPDGYRNNYDTNGSTDIPFLGHLQGGTPMKGSFPVPINMNKDIGSLDIPRGSPYANGSLFNHSIAKASYL